jgi:hypothetical protein
MTDVPRTDVFIGYDQAGLGSHDRFTHFPSGATCLHQPCMTEAAWHQRLATFLADYPGLSIHSCPNTLYAAPSNFIETVTVALERLRGTVSVA